MIDIEEVRRLLGQGVSVPDIAHSMRVTVTHFRRYARRAGVTLPHATVADGLTTLATVREALGSGASAVEAARLAGVSRQRVYQLIEKHKIEVSR